MKSRAVCSILVLMSMSCLAATYTWNNASGDHNFVRGSNWKEATDSTVFTIADEFRIDLSGDSGYSTLASDAIGNNLRVGYGATGELYITGGTSVFNGSCMSGRGATAKGYMSISGGEISFLNSYFTLGESGVGILDISNGTVKAARLNMATKALTTSQSRLSMTGGLIDLTTFLVCGTSGTADLIMNGGRINLGSYMTMAKDAGSIGRCTISAGQITMPDLLTVGDLGLARLAVGGTGRIRCGQLALNNQSAIQLNINGAAPYGNPITITASDSTLSGDFDPNFVAGTGNAGLYVVAAALQNKILTNEPNLLSPAAAAAGWTDQIINVGAGQAVLLTNSQPANNTTWTNSSSTQLWSNPGNWNTTLDPNDIAVIDRESTSGAIVNSTAVCGGLVVGSTANGALTVSSGSLTATSSAIIGSSGNGSLAIHGGTFSAGNLIAALNAGSSADILIDNNAVVRIDGIAGLGANAGLTLSGHQTSIEFGTLTTAPGSEINFVLDGALGVGNGLDVNGDVVLAGSIQLAFVGGVKADGTFTLLRSSGTITDKTGGNLIRTMPGSAVSYAIETEGTEQVLKVTLYSPATCEEVINAGLGYSADINQDCKVNMLDFAEMASQWLACNDPQQCN